MGAKRTPDLIPLCHPIAVHGVTVDLAVVDGEVRISATVRTADRTGVEMEALTAVAVAGLTVIDMIKAVDPAATPGRGAGRVQGRRPQRTVAAMTGRAAVITCSDSVAAGRHRDDSGPAAARALRGLGWKSADVVAVTDDGPDDRGGGGAAPSSDGARVVVTNGGTGLGPRDVTVPAVAALGGVLVPGIGEAIRSHSRGRVPTADLSRAGAYQVRSALVLCLPGSPGGVADGMAVAGPLLGACRGDDGRRRARPAPPRRCRRPTGRSGSGTGEPSPIDLAALVATVGSPGAGAVITFEGRVRNSDQGLDVAVAGL